MMVNSFAHTVIGKVGKSPSNLLGTESVTQRVLSSKENKMLLSIVMLVFGILAITKRNFKITRNRTVTGNTSRNLGIVLILGALGAFNQEPLIAGIVQLTALVIAIGVGIAKSEKIVATPVKAVQEPRKLLSVEELEISIQKSLESRHAGGKLRYGEKYFSVTELRVELDNKTIVGESCPVCKREGYIGAYASGYSGDMDWWVNHICLYCGDVNWY